MSALIQFFYFTAEQRRFVWRKQIAGTRTPAEWLELFRPLAAIESDLNSSGCLPVIGMVAGGILAYFGIDRMFDPGGVGPGLGMLLLGLALLVYTLGSRLVRLHGEHLASFLNPLLAVLREDMKPDDGITLQLDLRNPERRENRIDEHTLPPYGNYTKIVVTTFSRDWLMAEGCLADGTRLSWILTEVVQRSKRTKRNARRKTSWKTKYRVKTQIKLQVGLRTDRYELREPLPPDVQCVKDERRLWLKLRGHGDDDPARRFDAASFVRMVMGAFSHVRPVGGGA